MSPALRAALLRHPAGVAELVANSVRHARADAASPPGGSAANAAMSLPKACRMSGKRSGKRRRMGDDVHVVPSGDQWALEVDGQQRGTSPTQNEAIIRGRGLADNEGAELVIQGEDGHVREKDSNGNNPHDIPG
jgi:Uncharacterized protein conserved in bacteria (DUF2188)